MHLPGSQFALVAFDTERPFDRDMVERLERILQISERWSLGSGVKARAAVIAEGQRSSVAVASLSNIPGSHEEDHIVHRVDGALRQIGRDIVNGVWVRNIALVAFDTNLRPVADAAAALRTLLEQVGGGPADRFGKILRVFLPSGVSAEPTPEEWRTAAQRLQARLKQHAAELSRSQNRGVDFVEGEAGGGLEAKLTEALEVLSGSDMPGNVRTLAEEVRRLHKELIDQTCDVVRVQQHLMPRMGELGHVSKATAPPVIVDRLFQYCDEVLRPLAALEKLLK